MVELSAIAPAVIALIGVPLTFFLSSRRDDRLRVEQWTRDDKIRADRAAREDQLAERRLQDWIVQEWWQRKFETYSSILEALWHLKASNEETLEDIERMRSSDEVAHRRVPHDWLTYSTRLKQLADTGAFVISPEVHSAVRTFTRAEAKALSMYEEEDDDLGAMIASLNAAISCIEEVREAALKDLRVAALQAASHSC